MSLGNTYELALGDSTVSVKCIIIGCVLPSGHLREI